MTTKEWIEYVTRTMQGFCDRGVLTPTETGQFFLDFANALGPDKSIEEAAK